MKLTDFHLCLRYMYKYEQMWVNALLWKEKMIENGRATDNTTYESISFMTNSFELYDFGLASSIKSNENFPLAVKKAERAFRERKRECEREWKRKIKEKESRMRWSHEWLYTDCRSLSEQILPRSCHDISFSLLVIVIVGESNFRR